MRQKLFLKIEAVDLIVKLSYNINTCVIFGKQN